MVVTLSYISSFSILLPVIFGLLFFKRLYPDLKLLLLFFIFAAGVEFVNDMLALDKKNNLWIINIYGVLECLVLCYILGKWMHSKTALMIGVSLSLVYFLFWCYVMLIPENGLLTFNGIEKTIKSVILIGLAGAMMIVLSSDSKIMLTRNYRFWIGAAVLVYFSVNLIVFCSATFYLDSKNQLMTYTWGIHAVVNIISNILYTIGFSWCLRKTN